jgi:four helix bundle protein
VPGGECLVPVIKSYKDLQVWQKAVKLADGVYDAIEHFPRHELFGLANQLRRAAVSVASNIAEGSVRSTKEFQHFLSISRGSLAEIETQLLIGMNRGFISAGTYENLVQECDSLSRMLMSLLRSLNDKHQALSTPHKALNS